MYTDNRYSTLLKFNMEPENGTLQEEISFWIASTIILGPMLNLGSVPFIKCHMMSFSSKDFVFFFEEETTTRSLTDKPIWSVMPWTW